MNLGRHFRRQDVSLEKRRLNIAFVSQMVSGALVVLTLQTWQAHWVGRISVAILLMSLVTASVSCLCSLRSSYDGTLAGNAAVLTLVELSLLLLFISSREEVFSYFNSSSTSRFVIWSIYWVFAAIALIQTIQLIFCLVRGRGLILEFPRSRFQVLRVSFFAVGVVAIALIGVQFFNQWFRWDSAAYYVATERLTVLDVFQPGRDGLMVAGHPAGAYALLVMVCSLVPEISHLNAMYLANIVTGILTYILGYALLKRLVSLKKHDFVYPLLALAFCCSTYVMGSLSQLNPEHLCTVGLLLLVLGVVKKNYVFGVIGCYIACNTREVAVPVTALIILIQLSFELLDSREGKKVCWARINWAYYVAAFAIGISWLRIYSSVNWSAGMRDSSPYIYLDGTPLFSFALSPLYVVDQLRGFLLSNFMWIFAAMILVTVVVVAYKSRGHVFKALLSNRAALLCSVVCSVSLTILCLYVTHHNFRYYTESAVFLQLLGFAAVGYLAAGFIRKEIAGVAASLALGGALFIQCHATVDPVMIASFDTINTGKGVLATMRWNIEGFSNGQFLESSVYNFQTAYFDDAMDRAYALMDWSSPSGTKVLFYDGYQWGTRGNSFNSIWGMGYYAYDMYTSWNATAGRRELKGTAENNVDPVAVASTSQALDYVRGYSHVYYIELPWGDGLADYLKTTSLLDATPVGTVDYGGWVLQVYELSECGGAI